MSKNLNFKTNSRHIGQLGRELVTDFVTALVELVKNSYDADANSVLINIENANTPNSRIIVADTGSGMSQTEFEERWMVIGTGNKLSAPYTEKGRKKAGKKGIGRFSVERLAERVTIYSFTEKESFKVSLNWNLYEEISIEGLKQRIQILKNKNDVSAAKYILNQIEFYLSLQLKDEFLQKQKYVREMMKGAIDNYELIFNQFFLNTIENDILPILKEQEKVELKLEEIDNPLERIDNKKNEESYHVLEKLYLDNEQGVNGSVTGVVMVMERLRDNWRQKDIDKLQKELRLLVAPELIETDPFHIELIADQFDIPEDISVNSILDLRFASINARVYDNGKKSEIIYSDIDGNNKVKKREYEIPLLCGDLTFELYYFLRDPAHMKNETYNQRLALQVLNIYCGVKIYRDKFRVKPYGDVGNDWLELDKNKISDTHGYRVGNNQTIGVIRISDQNNPLLVDATNREGIIENEAYEHLKAFILSCMDLISQIRSEAYEKAKTDLDKAKEEKQEQKKREKKHRELQKAQYEKSLKLIKEGADFEIVKSELDSWQEEEEKFRKEKESRYEKTETAYENYVEMQETELSMYKNLATLGMLAGNFAHETQDIISRINNTLSYYNDLKPYINNEYFGKTTDIIRSDFVRISSYSQMMVGFLKKNNREVQEKLDFGIVLHDIIYLYGNMLQAFKVQYLWSSQPDICMTMRRIDLESIIINMITNAFEQIKIKEKKQIYIHFEEEEDYIYLYFEDSGNGVDVESREEIFKAFITSKEEGIGLGLNIVKDIVTSYGGKVYVTDSEEYGGAKFVIQFVKREAS